MLTNIIWNPAKSYLIISCTIKYVHRSLSGDTLTNVRSLDVLVIKI